MVTVNFTASSCKTVLVNLAVCLVVRPISCESTNHRSLMFTGIGLAQGLQAKAIASPNPGAIQRPQRRMVISHQMTRKMTELCGAYVLCVLRLLWTLPHLYYFFFSPLVIYVYRISHLRFMTFLPTYTSVSFEIIFFS